MANKTAEPLLLRAGDQTELERLTRSNKVTAAAAQRARIVLLAAEGVANYVIAERVGVTRPTVNLWRSRYAENGLAGLVGEKRPGRPRRVDRVRRSSSVWSPARRSKGTAVLFATPHCPTKP